MLQPHKFIYFGTPEFSTFVLEELYEAGYIPTSMVTTPDKPAGRGLELTPSPVKKWGLAHGIPLIQPATFDDATITELVSVHADFAVVAAYGKILPQRVLDLFPKGALNVHPSLLPRYRGTSPVESQILADESVVGVSVILMDDQMDHGPLVAQETISIPGWPVSRNEANEALWHAGGRLLASVLPAFLDGTASLTPQDHANATKTKKIAKEDGEIDLSSGHDRLNYLKYLAYEGWPGTYFFTGTIRIKITSASYKNGQFIIERVIPEGKKEMAYKDFTQSNSHKAGK